MNEYVAVLRECEEENPPNYGSDAHSILEMTFTYYHECNNTDTDAVKVAFEDLYQRMHGMPLREMDRIVDAVCPSGRWIESWTRSVPFAGSMKKLDLWKG